MKLTRRESLLVAVAGAVNPAPAAPTVEFGPARVSRLIAGGNPVSGISHMSAALSREMLDYFTSANIKRLLRDCEQSGVNTWQSRGDRHILRLLHEYRQEGGRIQWIAQTATEIDFERNLREIAGEKPVGIYLHGVRTDRAWMAGAIDTLQDALKAIRQTGARVGLGSHIPAVFDYVESKNWDLDFYMMCLYNLSRSAGENARLAGKPVPDELFWDPDRAEMLKRVRATSKQCLIFKVYGAGRWCGSQEQMLAALRQVAASAKPQDAVVIGMFPKRQDQVRENVRLLARAFHTS